jgi:hypothetical protein
MDTLTNRPRRRHFLLTVFDLLAARSGVSVLPPAAMWLLAATHLAVPLTLLSPALSSRWYAGDKVGRVLFECGSGATPSVVGVCSAGRAGSGGGAAGADGQ